MKNTLLMCCCLTASSMFIGASTVTAGVIEWIDVSAVPETSDLVINDSVLGMIRITTNRPAQAIFSASAGSLGDLNWADFNYINYDASSFGTSAPLIGTVTFEFLNGPIDTSLTPIYFTSIGLTEFFSYTINNDPVYLGDIAILEGTGTHTPLGGGWVRIDGAGFGHNPDLFRFNESFVASISVDIVKVFGDHVGFTIGAVAVPEPSSIALFAMAFVGLIIFLLREPRWWLTNRS